MHVFVVEDEPKTSSFISRALRSAGAEVEAASDGQTAYEQILQKNFNVVVLDIMLPRMDGLSVIRRLRGCKNRTPILLLSARGQVEDRVDGLNAGADDFLPKPFVLEELLARVQALGRRGIPTLSDKLVLGDLVLHTITHQAYFAGVELNLTTREFRLLAYLMNSAGSVCTRTSILREVWDYQFDPGTNLVEVYIKRLRDKLNEVSSQKLLHTVRHAGYSLRLES
ncbi:MAG: winged-helix transcriptional response regulator [Verrucomicrobiales bacterium]|jgi:two-component system OmpR family response regulator|nr:winged-helix transcriptional response regulator [Verrucomicrobiales bacterium]